MSLSRGYWASCKEFSFDHGSYADKKKQETIPDQMEETRLGDGLCVVTFKVAMPRLPQLRDGTQVHKFFCSYDVALIIHFVISILVMAAVP